MEQQLTQKELNADLDTMEFNLFYAHKIPHKNALKNSRFNTYSLYLLSKPWSENSDKDYIFFYQNGATYAQLFGY